MNYTTAIFIFNKTARAVRCSYDESDVSGTRRDHYTFKTLDQSIVVGDLVVVPTGTRHKATVVKVEEVDVDIDLDNTLEIKWVIDKVDITSHEKRIADEAAAIKTIKAAEIRKRREDWAKTLLPGGALDELKALPGVVLNGGTKKSDVPPTESGS